MAAVLKVGAETALQKVKQKENGANTGKECKDLLDMHADI